MPIVPDNQGNLRIITVAAPGAGVDWAFTQGVRVRWRILSVSAQFAADANSADRVCSFYGMVGGVLVFSFSVQHQIVTGETVQVTWSEITSTVGAVPGVNLGGYLGSMLYVNDQIILGVTTLNIQVGDQWSNIRIRVEEWIEPLV